MFDFELPEALIALRPARPRESARLLHIGAEGGIADRVVREAPNLFRAGDLLVFNDTRVIPARLNGVRVREQSSVAVEATLIERTSPSHWIALAKPGKRLRVGDRVRFAELDATIAAKGEDGAITLAFDLDGVALDRAIAAAGAMPLPPYIASKRPADAEDESDYQTIFAARDGAVAAPTAGLHFTEALLAQLDAVGVERRAVTLHVGAGTFLPVKVEDTDDHRMHAEWREMPSATADAVNRAKDEGRRVIAVGTTALRSLESAAVGMGRVEAVSGSTEIFISPGYQFKIVDLLWTNFHLPRSTLFMLVSDFAGVDRMKAAYAHAIAQGYRFYSYGDACLIELNQKGEVS